MEGTVSLPEEDSLFAEARDIFLEHSSNADPITETIAVGAGIIAERLFPPTTASDTLHFLCALNLLNAYIKTPRGKDLVSYNYIKGMASCLMMYLIDFPVEGVSYFLSLHEKLAYFRARGVQISFHYVPLYSDLLDRMAQASATPQTWDGMTLQSVAVELLELAGGLPEYGEAEEARVRKALLEYHRPYRPGNGTGKSPEYTHKREYVPRPREYNDDDIIPWERIAELCGEETPLGEQRIASLYAALRFNIWQTQKIMLMRRCDEHLTPVMRYNGKNYSPLIDFMTSIDRRIYQREKNTLEKSKLYHVSPRKRIKTIAPSSYILTIARNNYIRQSGQFYSLCLTYGIARYLAVMHSSLRFICILNYNRVRVRRKYYTLADLYRVSLHSKCRSLKVWMVIDPEQLLSDFDPMTLPRQLIDEFIETDEYYQEFEIIKNAKGLKGIYAFRRHHLLPCIYREIRLRNFHAHVQDLHGKWAIYSLGEERFRSPFIYDRIWYDRHRGAILAECDGFEVTIFQFRFRK